MNDVTNSIFHINLMQDAHIFILRKCKEIAARVYLASTLAGLDVVGMLEIVQKVLFITTVILSEILEKKKKGSKFDYQNPYNIKYVHKG